MIFFLAKPNSLLQILFEGLLLGVIIYKNREQPEWAAP